MQHNRKKVSLTLILSAEDNEALETIAFETGLKKSEFLRAIIQGIAAGSKIAAMPQGENVKFDLGGYGFTIPSDVMEDLLQDVSKKLIDGLEVAKIKPNKKLRYKRMKSMAQAS
jgi:hypothetical protein